MAKRTFFNGWKRQEPDYRDFHYVVPRTITAQLPPQADLSANMPPQLDQGELGACGPNSLDECAEFDEKVQGMAVASVSRLFIYWVTRSLMPGKPIAEDSGVDNRTMLKAVAKYGYCNESLWPYNIANLHQRLPANRALKKAAQQTDQELCCGPTKHGTNEGLYRKWVSLPIRIRCLRVIHDRRGSQNGYRSHAEINRETHWRP